MLNRRQLLGSLGLGLWGVTACPWLPALARAAGGRRLRRQCILLWMTGGPSQLDTFDMKPGHANGGEFQERETSVPGMRWSEHLPQLARQAERLAVVRSVSTREGDHGRGTYLMRTGHPPMGSARHPAIGASLAAADTSSSTVMGYVSIAPYRIFNPAAFGPGFLGPQYAPLTVGAVDQLAEPDPAADYAPLRVDDLSAGALDAERWARRQNIWQGLEDRFLEGRTTPVTRAHETAYRRALALMQSPLASAFDLEEEPAEVREKYGRGRFGQGCLMARRLIEHGVPFVEVSLGALSNNNLGWDTHQQNFPAVRRLSEELDRGWATLMDELADRGLLETTTILWMGEFGRTPRINEQAGRDHFPMAWTCAFAGGGIRGGQVYGRTSPDGMEVVDRPVNEGDLLATLCHAVGVDPDTEHVTPEGRPIRIAEGTILEEVCQDPVS